MPDKKPLVGLALGSGSARGLAHIGVIRALQDAGITVDLVAGTSIGALIGSVYAAGRLDAIERDYLTFDWKKIAYFFDMVFPRSGLIDGDKVADFILNYIHTDVIENLPLPFRAVATDIGTGEEIIFDHGDIVDAVRASISAPGIFTPVKNGDRILVDGGLVNPVPVSVVKMMGADMVIAVDLNHDIVMGKSPVNHHAHNKQDSSAAIQTEANSKPGDEDQNNPSDEQENGFLLSFTGLSSDTYREAMERINRRLESLTDHPALRQIRAWLEEEPLPNIFEIMLASINIMENQITRTRLRIDPPDILIQPPLGSIRFLEFHRAEEIIKIGYQETVKQLERYEKRQQKRQ